MDPCAPSVAADATWIANITPTAEIIPEPTSTRIARSCASATGPTWGWTRPSSTSSLACQKKRYGEIVVPNTAIRAATYVRSPWNRGRNVFRATSAQGTSTTASTTTYATSERVSHRRTFAYRRYGTNTSRASMAAVMPTTSTTYGTPTSSRTEAAIEPMSAPMLKTFAATTSVTEPISTQRGNLARISLASPSPDTSPRRAAVSCTAAASGSETSAVHSRPNRKAAPTWE